MEKKEVSNKQEVKERERFVMPLSYKVISCC